MSYRLHFPAFRYHTSWKYASCLLLVIVSDWLFYKENGGWVQGVFWLLLLAASVLHTAPVRENRQFKLCALAALGLSLSFIESPNLLAVVLILFTLSVMCFIALKGPVPDARDLAKPMLRYCFAAWWRFISDARKRLRLRGEVAKRSKASSNILRHWLLPIGSGLVFVLLFAKANPVISGWIEGVDADFLKAFADGKRLFGWLLSASLCWAFIRPKFWRRRRKQKAAKQRVVSTGQLFNARSILISLILFNGLFLVQNALDAVFLWSGAELPKGMTHAQYAHQGAYPLIVTALLAAAFVLIAMKPASDTESDKMIRLLVYGWVAQNIFLVMSSIIRLLRYIEDYSLTYLRIAALIWMAIVALGLCLIIARIYLQRDNAWLVNRNALMLYATLYVCCFINIGGFIADVNVRTAHEVTGQGAALDITYLQNSIGEEAVPALRWYEAHYMHVSTTARANVARRALEAELARSAGDWRAWTFRQYRLRQMINK